MTPKPRSGATSTRYGGDSGRTKVQSEIEEFLNDTYALGEAYQTVYDRPDTHGAPEDSFARIAGMWRSYLMGKDPEEIDAVDVSNMMSLLKIARSAEGHYHKDNWTDLAGYAENSARLAQRMWMEEDDV